MDFQYALTALKEGKRVKRSGWEGNDFCLVLQKNEEGEEPWRNSHCIMKTTSGASAPWLWTPSQTDILADDWGYIV